MRRRHPAPGRGTHRRTTVWAVPLLSPPPADRLLGQPVVVRLLSGRLIAGPSVADAVRVAEELLAQGRRVALEHRPGEDDDVVAELTALVQRAPAGDVELTLPVDRLGPRAAELAAAAAARGLGAVLEGPARAVDELHAALPAARVVVPAAEPGAEERCRELAGGRVRLQVGRGRAADLAFVRCLNVLMSAGGTPAVAASDPRLVAITGERAAWNGRSPASWEHVMPFGIRTDEQRRLVAAGAALRVAVPSGAGAVAALARRAGGRR